MHSHTDLPKETPLQLPYKQLGFNRVILCLCVCNLLHIVTFGGKKKQPVVAGKALITVIFSAGLFEIVIFYSVTEINAYKECDYLAWKCQICVQFLTEMCLLLKTRE